MTSSANNAGKCATSGVPEHPLVSSSPSASSATSDADQTLLKQIAAGNEDALRQLYAAYPSALVAVCVQAGPWRR